MNEPILYSVTTTMEKEDYRKFLYLATFRKSPVIIPLLFLMAAIGALVTLLFIEELNLFSFFLVWVLLSAAVFATICFKVEHKNKRRIATDKTGAFDSPQVLDFYSEYLVTANECVEGTNKIRYDQFYRILETKDYFILYYNANMASLIRKKDMNQDCEIGIKELLKEKFANRYKVIR